MPGKSNWLLPESPEAYKPIIEKIEGSSPSDGAAHFIEGCMDDFYFFMRYCSTIGRTFVCKESGCEHIGRPMFDHPWVFDRCREVQESPDWHIDLWGRFHLKTSIITVGYTTWELLHDSSLCFGIGTNKFEDSGERFLRLFRDEWEKNEILKKHWPGIFWSHPSKEAPIWKSNALTLKRSVSRSEPTIHVFGLDALATSYHYDRQVWDDLVTERSIKSETAAKNTLAGFHKAVGMQGQDCRMRIVGTHWDQGDAYTDLADGGVFTVRWNDCYDEEGQSVLHPGSPWIERWRGLWTEPYFNCQMRNIPMDESKRSFLDDWLKFYDGTPEEEAVGKSIYYFVDSAGDSTQNKLDDTDYVAIVGVALGADGNIYVIDIIRDRMSTKTLVDTIFSIDRKWRNRGNPVKSWYYEQSGAQRDIAFIQREMEARKYRTLTIKVAKENLKKEMRILRLQRPFESGEIWLPHKVIHETDGHEDNMVTVFLREEYRAWSPRSKGHDDILDCMSFMLIPKIYRELEYPMSHVEQTGYSNVPRKHRPSQTNPWAA